MKPYSFTAGENFFCLRHQQLSLESAWNTPARVLSLMRTLRAREDYLMTDIVEAAPKMRKTAPK